MKKRRVWAMLLCVAMIVAMIPASAFAETGGTITKTAAVFADMPADWSTAALQNAVNNGLISGSSVDGKHFIKPNDSLTRAEMGTILNNAFGAEQKASLTGVTDVAASAWYYDQMAKAVQMGSFAVNKQLRPEAFITRQETATVLAKVFKLPEAKTTALDSFTDKTSVAAWAKGYVASMAENGYMAGSNGKLNPTGNITRAEFAAIMNNMVAQYIKTAGTVSEVVAKGNVMINVPGVTLKNVTVNGNLILGDGIGTGDVTLDNVKVTGETVVRGGGVKSFIVKGNSDLGTIIIAKVDGNVRVSVEGNAKVDVIEVADGKNDVIVEGTVAKLVVEGAVPVVAQKADIKTIEINAPKAELTVDKNSKVGTVAVGKEASSVTVAVSGTVTTVKTEGAKTEVKAEAGAKITKVEATKDASAPVITVAKDAKIETVTTAAPKTEVKGEGTVNKVEAKEGADNSKVTTPGTTVSADKNTEGVVAGSGSDATEVKPGGSAESAGTKPSTGGGGGGGGGHTDYAALAREALHAAIVKAIEPTNTALTDIAKISLNGNTAVVEFLNSDTTAEQVLTNNFMAELFSYAEIKTVTIGAQEAIDIPANATEEQKRAVSVKIMTAVAAEAALGDVGAATPIGVLHGKRVSALLTCSNANAGTYADSYTVAFIDPVKKLQAAIEAAVAPTNKLLQPATFPDGIAELAILDQDVTVEIKATTATALEVFDTGFLAAFFAYGEITTVTVSGAGEPISVTGVTVGDKDTYAKIMSAVASKAGLADVSGSTTISELSGKAVTVKLAGVTAGGVAYEETYTVNFTVAQAYQN